MLENTDNSGRNSYDSSLDLRIIVEKYLGHWQYFLIALFIGLLLAFLKLNFERPLYSSSAAVKIKNEQSGDRTALSAFEDLGIIPSTNQKVEDEIEILLSKDLFSEVIKSLKLNIQFFTDQNKISKFLDENLSFETNHYEVEEYKNQPLEINFLMTDSLVYKTASKFLITIQTTNNFIYKDIESGIEKRGAFGDKFTTVFGEIIITPNLDYDQKELIGNKVFVQISSVRALAAIYAQKIAIEPKSEFSSILSITMKDGVRRKANDIINQLILEYNKRAITLKDELSKSTSDFVTKRLEIISNELSQVDLTAETIKTRYRISDVASQTGLNMQSGQEIENRIVQANARLENITAVKDFVSEKNENDLIPVNVGIEDANVASAMNQYNELILRKKKLLDSSTEKNPIVVKLTEQISLLKSNIDQGLNSLENTQKISLDALNQQDLRINSRLYSAPKQERQYRDIQRQQQIKEALYLYLLEKREETALTLGVADPNAKIIDMPSSSSDPVSPKKFLTYVGFAFVSLILPIMIIYLLELLDSKVRTREDLEKSVRIPILGEIPKINSKGRYLVESNDYTSVAEAFRILRTNLNFILPDHSTGQNGKTIFVTSTVAHEGKSFITSNLSSVLAHAGKKTVLLGMDIRAPKLKQYLGVRGNDGITNFIINKNLSPEDLLVEVPNNPNLTVISSGDIAPNPSELLMNSRVKELFDYCRANFDYVVVDTAAYSMVTDTLVLSKFADAFIYVIRANYLDKRFLNYIDMVHKEKRLNNLAVLLNDVDFKKSYGYGYGYGYGVEFKKSKGDSNWKRFFRGN